MSALHFLAFLHGLFDGADEVESRLWEVVEFAVKDLPKAFDGLFDGDKHAGDACKLFGHMKGL